MKVDRMAENERKKEEIKPGEIVRDQETDRVMMIVEILEDRERARTNDRDFQFVPLNRLEPVQS